MKRTAKHLLLGLPPIFASWWMVSNPALSADPAEILLRLPPLLLWTGLILLLFRRGLGHHAVAGYALFILTMLADQLNFGDTSPAIQLAYFSLATLALVPLLLLRAVTPPRLAWLHGTGALLLLLPLFLVPFFYIVHALEFGTEVTPDALYAVLQTNAGEALEFLRTQLPARSLAAAAALLLLVGALALGQQKSRHQGGAMLPLSAILLLASSVTWAVGSEPRIYSLTGDAIATYEEELSRFLALQERVRQAGFRPEATKSGEGETYVVVIGESLNRDHMSLYGYPRETTPQLDTLAKQGKLLVFREAFASHTHTMQTLSLALTEANQRNGLGYFDAPSLVNVLQAADFRVDWITNQARFGPWDNLVSVIARQADTLTSINHMVGREIRTSRHDDAVVPHFVRLIEERTSRNRAIFIHLMGSHGDYCERTPPEQRVFDSPLETALFGKMAERADLRSLINCYDNSVRFNDSVISRLLTALQRKEGVSALLYFADHGEDVFGRRGHNSTTFSFPMTRIPLLLWLSEGYRQRYPGRTRILAAHTEALFSNDRIHDTVLGLAAVRTPHHDTRNDLSSAEYRLDPPQALTLHGQRLYTEPAHRRYHQRHNATLQGADARLLPHRVDTIGKLRQLWADGYRGLEVDVLFEESDGPRFAVGHDRDHLAGISLERLLESVETSALRKIWLDLKNLTDENVMAVLSRLERLDRRFSLKDLAIIETPSPSPLVARLREAGWQTSYYLPTGELRDLMASGDDSALLRRATEIARQVSRQRMAAVSFDWRLYPFVKRHLEPLLDPAIRYHLWDLSLAFHDPDLPHTLAQTPWYGDERVDTALLRFDSPFDL